MLALAATLGLLVGAVIGGLGGGGGVLTVPALVYVLGQTAQDATTSSAVIVGSTAAVGALARIRGGGVDWRNGIALGVVGIPTAYLGTLLNHRVGQPVLLLAFAALTVVAAVAMLAGARGNREPATDDDADGAVGGGGTATAVRVRAARADLLPTAAKVVACGAVVGFLTGFLGVGGGFLVVPALVIVLRMPMALAVGTSLLVIVVNSLSSVVSRLGSMDLDWRVIAPFVIAAVLGALIGRRVADRLSGGTLTTSFAIMLAIVGIVVGVQSLVAL